MENSDWLNYKIQVRERLRTFSLKILVLSDMFPNTQSGRILNNQLTRSGTLTYAIYRAALRGRSKREFFAKLSISVKEADETEMWLDLIVASEMIKSDFVKNMYNESLELLKILSSMRKRSSD
jgi:four helix bundle protein